MSAGQDVPSAACRTRPTHHLLCDSVWRKLHSSVIRGLALHCLRPELRGLRQVILPSPSHCLPHPSALPLHPCPSDIPGPNCSPLLSASWLSLSIPAQLDLPTGWPCPSLRTINGSPLPTDMETPLLLLLFPLLLPSFEFLFHALPILQVSLRFQVLCEFVHETLHECSQSVRWARWLQDTVMGAEGI